LSGDINPLHADPDMAAIGGFDRPILHGLCGFGIAGRALLKHFCAYDPARLKSLRVRFAKHVFPGETLVTEMWKMGDSRIVFRTTVKERGEVVLANAAAEVQSVSSANEKPAAAPAPCAHDNGAADPVTQLFREMDERIRQTPGLIEKVGGIYRFVITGPNAAAWTVDLKNSPGSAKLENGSPDPTKPDCTITVAGQDFLDMHAGTLNPQVAFMQGKLKLDGNLAFATKLELVMKQPGAKA
jgi:3-hydroxyacyl-CoA dehydrogenase/3a,7a,12a-trihydroxy-5b-cholest-24-enoyl-CoA hydratase